jgi:D-lactate dehydrogenase (cytochrome)
VQAAVCQFPTLEAAIQVVIQAMQMGVGVARIELFDEVQIDAVIRYSKLEGYERIPTLFIEFHGAPAAVAEQVGTMQALAAEAGGSGFKWAAQPEDRSRLWKARHQNYEANVHYRTGHRMIGTDACVPISALAACILETKEDIARSGLVAPLVGHAGDGNFHLAVLFDPDEPGARERAEALSDRVSLRAIRYGGTCTGEHGIGSHRIHQLQAEHGDAVDLMRAIKVALDPAGIMNPGKMLPEAA